MKYQVSAILILVLSLCLSGCSSFLDNYNRDIWDGDFTEIGTGTISTGSLQLVISDESSVFNGLKISVTDGYSGPSVDFSIESGSLPDDNFGEYFTPLDEMLRIDNGGEFSTSTFYVEVPISSLGDEIPIAFAYNETTGSLDPLPIVSYDNSSLTFAARNFSQTGYDSDFKSSTSTDAKNYLDIVISVFNLASLNSHDAIMSNFVPGIDDWEFPNYGSVVEPEGICAGATLAALFYYDYKIWANHAGLTNLYDRDTSIWQDNTSGIRLVSEIQSKEFEVSAETIWNDFFTKQPNASESAFYETYSKSAFTTLAAQLLISEKPVLTILAPENNQNDIHAVLIFGINRMDSILYIADPNFPGEVRIAELKRSGYFEYISGKNARASNNITYARFMCLGFSQMSNWKIVADYWRELNDGIIGDQRFPVCEYKVTFNHGVENENTITVAEINKTWLGGLSVSSDNTSIRISGKDTNAGASTIATNIWVYYYDNDNNLQILRSDRDKNYVDLDIESNDLYNSSIGLFISQPTQDSHGNKSYEWVDFKWLNISEITLDPKDISGNINEELAWEVKLGDPPSNTRLEWSFGDSSGTLIKKNSLTATHTYTEDGIYPILVMAYDDDTNDFRGVAAGMAKIGAKEFEMTISDNQGKIIDWEVERCKQLSIILNFPDGTIGTHSYSIDFGNGDQKKDNTIISSSYGYSVTYEAGTYDIVASLMDNNKNVIDKVESQIYVPQNDLTDNLKSATRVRLNAGPSSATIYEDDQSYYKNYNADALFGGDSLPIVWTGQSFNLHHKTDYEEVKISGTLSSDCWLIETISVSYSSFTFSWEITATNIPIKDPKCPHLPSHNAHYSLNSGEAEAHISSIKSKIRRSSSDDYINHRSIDFGAIYLNVDFGTD